MASQNDQVIINFGPARYDSPKAIRNQIEATAVETQENTVNQIINDPNIDLGGGGGGAISDVTVNTYSPVTGLGTGTGLDGISYGFTNGTGVYLVPGDVVVLVDAGAEEYYAVGVTERSGDTTPIDQPIAIVDPNFPLNIGALTLPLRTDGGNPSNATTNGSMTSGHDLAGEFGQGVDLVFGQNAVTSPSSINAFCRDNSANSSLFTSPSAVTNNVMYLQPGSGGRIISFNATSRRTLVYRLPGAGAWTTPSVGTANWAIDQDTGWVWGVTSSSTTPFTHTVYRFAPTDAAPVNMGAMNIPLTNGSVLDPWVAAGNGYLTVSSVVVGFPALRTYCVKPSADSTNFTQLGTFAIASWDPTAGNAGTNAQITRLQVDSNGGTSYMQVTAATLRIRSLAQSLVITDYNTGIPAADMGFNHKHLQSGLVGIVAPVLTTIFGDPNPLRYTAALATYNYSSTSYQYYDIATYGSSATPPRFGALQEVTAGVVRYTYGSSNTSSTLLVELSGL